MNDPQSHPLSAAEFSQIVRTTPLVSIDIVLRDPAGRVMTGMRNNEPARNTYFVPGGVIRKDEPIVSAFSRILKTETGLEIPSSSARFLGVYEHFYGTNRFSEPGYGTHYVVLAYELALAESCRITLDDQHSEVLWLSPDELLAHPSVHENTKAYFRT